MLAYLGLLCEMGKGALRQRVGPVKSVLGTPHTSVSGLVGRARAALLSPWTGILSSAQAAQCIQWTQAQINER